MQTIVISFPCLVRHEDEKEPRYTATAHAQISMLPRFAARQ